MTPAERFGADSTEWVARWDAGQVIWSFNVGAMQVAIVETVRVLQMMNLPPDAFKEPHYLDTQDLLDQILFDDPDSRLRNVVYARPQGHLAYRIADHIHRTWPDTVDDAAGRPHLVIAQGPAGHVWDVRTCRDCSEFVLWVATTAGDLVHIEPEGFEPLDIHFNPDKHTLHQCDRRP